MPEITEPVDAGEDAGPWEGPARGGPLDGTTQTSRYPRGLLAADRPAGLGWLYDWTGREFVARNAGVPVPLIEDPGAPDNRYRAAEEGDFDVIAVPDAGDDPATVDAYTEDDGGFALVVDVDDADRGVQPDDQDDEQDAGGPSHV
ncbi:MAG TPA: hypothetical protein VF657_25765 [Actinoplanes sp.]|jgi:hypothetical protein